ncbi:hypothetical protein [Novosphingobium sp. PP1Y]|uniref:hypothetical protein n=1 Tax=Novosphingobium sp. PP1Y TaxID=702113 RepID=UPI000303A3E1|nr:hypothetical protein [Novosphingobium sp. PP1Y]
MNRPSLTIAGLLAVTIAPPAQAGESNLPGIATLRIAPADLQWSTSDRITIERARTRRLVDDSGISGWGLDFVSLRSRHPGDEPGSDARMKVHARQVSVEGWQDIGADTELRLRAHAGMTSRMDRESALLVAKTKTVETGLEATVRHASGWRVRCGWFAQGGWGGHSLQDDAMRMTNGESGAAQGARLVFEMPVAGPALFAHALMSLEARTGSKAIAPGQPVPHQNEVALRMSTSF